MHKISEQVYFNPSGFDMLFFSSNYMEEGFSEEINRRMYLWVIADFPIFCHLYTMMINDDQSDLHGMKELEFKIYSSKAYFDCMYTKTHLWYKAYARKFYN